MCPFARAHRVGGGGANRPHPVTSPVPLSAQVLG